MKIAQAPPSCRVYTSPGLAKAMVCALGDAPRAHWLEPAHGRGVFLEAIASMGVGSDRIVGVDLDPTATAADELATAIRGVDFLRWAGHARRKFDRIVGNPPFVSISQLPRSLQRSAASLRDDSGVSIGKGANLWYAFTVASLRLLRPGGQVAFILPAAAEFADYASTIRRVATERFGNLEIYKCLRPLFDDVQEGAMVVVARGYGEGPAVVSRRFFETRDGLIRGLSAGGAVNGRKCAVRQKVRASRNSEFRSIGKIELGGVTGDARFFLMSETARRSFSLPIRAMTPVVSRARHLRSSGLTQSDWLSLKASGERIWLFDPSNKVVDNPAVRRYLELKVADGGCDRTAFKVSNRDPWYRTPMPSLPDAFMSGMNQCGPWLCINETGRVNATNTLYVVRFDSRDRDEWYMWALAFLSSEARRQIRKIGRRYADGLVKYEPGSIGRIHVPTLRRDVNHKDLYQKAVDALVSGEAKLSRDIADSARI